MDDAVVLGVDAGGTSTRAWACTSSGRVVGRGRAGGANVRSAVGDPAANIAAAVREALANVESAPVAVCVGIAGTEARREEVEALVRRGLADAGVDSVAVADADADVGSVADADVGAVPQLVLSDLDIAYRAVAPCPTGRLLLAGTGAVAASFVDWRLVDRRDGLGWLLGDAGSGVWIGRRVLRAVATHLDGGTATAMTPQVLALLDISPTGSAGSAQDLVRATDGLVPSAWGRGAPVALALSASDPIAERIVDEAATALLASLAGLATGRSTGSTADGPVVLAGGLLSAGPLRERIERHVDVAGHASDPVVGACRIAAAAVGLTLPRDVS